MSDSIHSLRPLPARWRRYLPPAPALPRSLGLTGGGLLLALLSYWFRAELWPNHPAAADFSLTLVPIGLVALIWQLVGVLLGWLAGISGPWWLRLLGRVVVVGVKAGAALLLTLLLLASLLALAMLA